MRARAGPPAGGTDAVLAAARRSAADGCWPSGGEHDRAGTFPVEAIEAIWDAGLGNLSLPAPRRPRPTCARRPRWSPCSEPGTRRRRWSWSCTSCTCGCSLPRGAALRPACARRSGLLARRAGAGQRAVREPDLCTLRAAVAGRARTGRAARRLVAVRARDLLHRRLRAALAVRLGRHRRATEGRRLVRRARATRPASRSRRPGTISGCAASASHDVVLEDVLIPLDHAFGLAPGRGRDGRDVLAAWMLLLLAVCRGAARAAADRLDGTSTSGGPRIGAPLAGLPAAVGHGEIERGSARRRLAEPARPRRRRRAGRPRRRPRRRWSRPPSARELIEASGPPWPSSATPGSPGTTRSTPLPRRPLQPCHTPQEDAVLLQRSRRPRHPKGA